MIVDKQTRDLLIKIQTERKLSLEGNILKVLEAEKGDTDFENYLKVSLDKDRENRIKRLEITKQIQLQNKELNNKQEENQRINEELKIALFEAENAKKLAEEAKEAALDDLELVQKKAQTELIGMIVRIALWVIVGVGVVTTLMYMLSIITGKDTQMIGSTWSNMFGILLTNAFSIVGTIMGVKYASENKEKKN